MKKKKVNVKEKERKKERRQKITKLCKIYIILIIISILLIIINKWLLKNENISEIIITFIGVFGTAASVFSISSSVDDEIRAKKESIAYKAFWENMYSVLMRVDGNTIETLNKAITTNATIDKFTTEYYNSNLNNEDSKRQKESATLEPWDKPDDEENIQ